jgi:putative CocE/NonD family hydrolase
MRFALVTWLVFFTLFACGVAPDAGVGEPPGSSLIETPAADAATSPTPGASDAGTGQTSAGGHVRVPMRDGVTLDTIVLLPRDVGRGVPAILLRTPYPPAAAEQTFGPFTTQGYAVLIQSCRGTGASGGVLDPLRQEFDDGQDAVRWVTRQPWSNGRIGTIGASYEGFTAIAAAVGTPEVDVVISDGAISDAFSGWPLQRGIPMATGLLWWLDEVRSGHDLTGDATYLSNVTNARPLVDLDVRTHGHDDGTWRAFAAQSENRSAFWDERSLVGKMSAMCAPALYIQASNEWSDDPLEAFQAATASPCSKAAGRQQRFILGPHSHAGAVYDPFAATPQGMLLRAYLDRFLKDAGANLDAVQPVQYYVTGAEAWRSASVWPPSATRLVRYLDDAGGGSLATALPPRESSARIALDPSADDACTSLPTAATAVYATAPFEDVADVIGAPELVATITTTSADADIAATLYEQTPTGDIVWSTAQHLRLRFRNGYATPQAMPIGTPTEVHVAWNSTAHRIAKGNSLVLLLASTECGLPENPGTLAPTMSTKSASSSSITFHAGPSSASRLVLPIQ